jgi:hypothetical protein
MESNNFSSNFLILFTIIGVLVFVSEYKNSDTTIVVESDEIERYDTVLTDTLQDVIVLEEPPITAGVDGRNVLDIIVSNANKYVGVKEQGGNNRGKMVEYFLRVVGLGSGHPWCTAFVCTVLFESGVKNPMSGWTPSLSSHKSGKRIENKQAEPGMVITLYYSHLKREGHSGIIVERDNKDLLCVEGNTTIRGTRETTDGKDGVNVILRPIESIHRVILFEEKI